MATWFYAAHRALRLKDVLLATVHQPQFTDLELVKNDDRVRLAVLDIRDPMFWKSNYTLLRAIFPVLRALRYCDSNTPAMDKIYYLTNRATDAINKSMLSLNDTSIFAEMEDDSGVSFEKSQIFESKSNMQELYYDR